jgi:polyisoprenoid-binding protein YceI
MHRCSPARFPVLHLFVSSMFCAGVMLATTPPLASAGGVDATTTIRFTGSSTLHEFEGTAPGTQASLKPSAQAGRWDADLVIPVAKMETGNGSRDARMWEMFHADRWPEIRVALRDVDPDAVQSSGKVSAALTIGEATHDVVAIVTNWKRDGARVSFDAAATVSLAAFGLEAPSVLGLVKVDDEVKVEGHVELVVGADTAPAS